MVQRKTAPPTAGTGRKTPGRDTKGLPDGKGGARSSTSGDSGMRVRDRQSGDIELRPGTKPDEVLTQLGARGCAIKPPTSGSHYGATLPDGSRVTVPRHAAGLTKAVSSKLNKRILQGFERKAGLDAASLSPSEAELLDGRDMTGGFTGDRLTPRFFPLGPGDRVRMHHKREADGEPGIEARVVRVITNKTSGVATHVDLSSADAALREAGGFAQADGAIRFRIDADLARRVELVSEKLLGFEELRRSRFDIGEVRVAGRAVDFIGAQVYNGRQLVKLIVGTQEAADAFATATRSEAVKVGRQWVLNVPFEVAAPRVDAPLDEAPPAAMARAALPVSAATAEAMHAARPATESKREPAGKPDTGAPPPDARAPSRPVGEPRVPLERKSSRSAPGTEAALRTEARSGMDAPDAAPGPDSTTAMRDFEPFDVIDIDGVVGTVASVARTEFSRLETRAPVPALEPYASQPLQRGQPAQYLLPWRLQPSSAPKAIEIHDIEALRRLPTFGNIVIDGHPHSLLRVDEDGTFQAVPCVQQQTGKVPDSAFVDNPPVFTFGAHRVSVEIWAMSSAAPEAASKRPPLQRVVELPPGGAKLRESGRLLKVKPRQGDYCHVNGIRCLLLASRHDRPDGLSVLGGVTDLPLTFKEMTFIRYAQLDEPDGSQTLMLKLVAGPWELLAEHDLLGTVFSIDAYPRCQLRQDPAGAGLRYVEHATGLGAPPVLLGRSTGVTVQAPQKRSSATWEARAADDIADDAQVIVENVAAASFVARSAYGQLQKLFRDATLASHLRRDDRVIVTLPIDHGEAFAVLPAGRMALYACNNPSRTHVAVVFDKARVQLKVRGDGGRVSDEKSSRAPPTTLRGEADPFAWQDALPVVQTNRRVTIDGERARFLRMKGDGTLVFATGAKSTLAVPGATRERVTATTADGSRLTVLEHSIPPGHASAMLDWSPPPSRKAAPEAPVEKTEAHAGATAKAAT